MRARDFHTTKAAFLLILLQQGIVTQEQKVPMNGYLNNPPPEEKDTARDLGADSLDHVEICMAVEDEWNIEIEDSVAEKLLTVGDFINHICLTQGVIIPQGELA